MEYSELVKNLAKPGLEIAKEINSYDAHHIHMSLGIAGEAGELVDAVKKIVIYHKEIDRQHIVEEMGDLEFYLEGLRQGLRITREEVIKYNINKLSKRYSLGSYSDEQAINRSDKPDEPK